MTSEPVPDVEFAVLRVDLGGDRFVARDVRGEWTLTSPAVIGGAPITSVIDAYTAAEHLRAARRRAHDSIHRLLQQDRPAETQGPRARAQACREALEALGVRL